MLKEPALLPLLLASIGVTRLAAAQWRNTIAWQMQGSPAIPPHLRALGHALLIFDVLAC